VIDLPKTLLNCVVIAGVGGLGVLVAPPAVAESPCIPETMAMSPQPVLSCPGQAPAPFPQSAPLRDSAHRVDGPPPTDPGASSVGVALPPPGQAPHIPPVVNPDGSPVTFDQGGYLGQLWDQFHSGVPSDLIYGPPQP
jgi:hypothetical protein